jgi:hypothetical protein
LEIGITGKMNTIERDVVRREDGSVEVEDMEKGGVAVQDSGQFLSFYLLFHASSLSSIASKKMHTN